MRIPIFDVESDSDDDEEEEPGPKNVFFLGPSKSGKSSIIRRLIKNEFSLYYSKTVSIQIHSMLGLNFYEIPSCYKFNHKFFVDAHVVCIVDHISPLFWDKFLSMVNVKHGMEVIFVTQNKNVSARHRLYVVDSLANTGFKALMREIINF